jgi:hypothetical protein
VQTPIAIAPPEITVRSEIAAFEKISISEIRKVELLNRRDRKYILSLDQLISILRKVKDQYSAVHINDIPVSEYRTEYYDTPNFGMYLDHQNGKLNRYKIRRRTYLDTDNSFLEVKFKNSKKVTDKKRTLSGEAKQGQFIEEHSPYIFDALEQKLVVEYSRFTLVDNNISERVTIDINLRFRNAVQKKAYPELMVLELKQSFANRNSIAAKALRDFRIRPIGFSKYCMGVFALNSDIKQNLMKEKWRDLNKSFK